MSGVSVIGLGSMGLVLARTLLDGGRSVTVWNRTSGRADALVEAGAKRAASVAKAIESSPIAIICVSDYGASRQLLEAEEAARAVEGKVLVQLTTGTPQDAREGEAWARERGAEYLDGAIMAAPSQVGRPDTSILVSGSPQAFERAEEVLQVLGGSVRFVGEAPGAAAAWDLAILSHLFGGLLGFYHGARIMESEGIGVDALGEAAQALAPVIGEMVRGDAEAIHAGDFALPEASLEVCWKGMDLVLKQAREASLNLDFPAFATSLYGKGMDAGLGGEKSAALIKVLRAGVTGGRLS